MHQCHRQYFKAFQKYNIFRLYLYCLQKKEKRKDKTKFYSLRLNTYTTHF